MSLPRPEPVSSLNLSITIEFTVDPEVDAVWDEGRVADLVRSILGREFPGGGAYLITLHLVGDEAIRAMNAEHRGIDAHTDVLSFPLGDSQDPHFVLPPGQPVELGDVVVSHPRALQQALEFGHSTDREVGYLVAHGLLHVLGYDHEDDLQRSQMREREEEALRPLGFTR